jgi:hypothetical protein
VLTDLARRYRWADEDIDLAWTVAVIEGLAADDVIRVYGGDPGQPAGACTFAQLADVQGDIDAPQHHLQVIVHNGLVCVVEWHGWTGTLPEIARRCSVGGRFFAVHWSLSSNPRINQAVDGRVVAYFEMFAGDKPYAGEPAPAWITDGVSVDVDAMRSTALALMEQQTGLAFDRRWLDQVRPAYRVPDPDLLFRDVPGAREP